MDVDIVLVETAEGPPKHMMLTTSGIFTLMAADGAPKLDSFLSVAEGDVTTDETEGLVEAYHEGSLGLSMLELGESRALSGEGVEDDNFEDDGGFRYTNGVYGGNGGKVKWLKCESKCKGKGFGGYGFCLTSGEGQPWGGCMAPGSDPAIERPPKLYEKNRVRTDEVPRAHRNCKAEHSLWVTEKTGQVAVCSECEGEDYFLVPSRHVKNMMLGACFRIDQYQAWVDAVKAVLDQSTVPMQCSIFSNGKGMRNMDNKGKLVDQWDSAPKTSPYNPRGFVCSTASSLTDHTVRGELKEGEREMRIFRTTIARFVMCHTNSEDAAFLRCVKKKQIGGCKQFNVRNVAFDGAAYHLKSVTLTHNGTNATDWDNETSSWDTAAYELGLSYVNQTGWHLGLEDCSEEWAERLLSVH